MYLEAYWVVWCCVLWAKFVLRLVLLAFAWSTLWGGTKLLCLSTVFMWANSHAGDWWCHERFMQNILRSSCKVWARLGQLGSVRDGCIYMNHLHTSWFEKVRRCVGLSGKADEDLWGRANFRFKWSRKLVWVWGTSGVWAGIFRFCVQAVSHTSVSTGHYLLAEQMVRN